MGVQRTHSFHDHSSRPPQRTTRFGVRPFEAPVQLMQKGQPTPEDIENEAFDRDKSEAHKLNLKEQSGTITPEEQEQLGGGQTGMEDFRAQRMERTQRFGHNFANIRVTPPGEHDAPPIQPMGGLGTPGMPLGGQRSLFNFPQQLSASPIQRQLTIGQPDDKYEQEADRVASQVVEQINAPASAQSTQGQSVQRQEENQEELQTKPEITPLQRQEENQEELQTKSTLKSGEAIAGGEASPDLDTAINHARGGGQPLDAGLQQSMGQAMGADFSGVRVHTDAQSDQLNQSIQAKAFTTGQDVFFRQGAYEPGGRGGQELIAHELTHVVQQGGSAKDSPQPKTVLEQPSATKTAFVQRKIERSQWDSDIAPNLTNTTVALVLQDNDNSIKKGIRKNNNQYELFTPGVKGWAKIDNLNGFLSTHTWNRQFKYKYNKDAEVDSIDFTENPSLHSNIDPNATTVPMDVQDIAEDRHNILHYSYSTYLKQGQGKKGKDERREAGHHLTVENAHLLLVHGIARDKTAAYTDKTELDKPGVNERLKADNKTEIDNLNFFPKKAQQTAKPLTLGEQELPTTKLPKVSNDEAPEDIDTRLSLQEYLTFISQTLTNLPEVPPVYGAKILHSARVMQATTGLDPAQMFLKLGKGDQRQMVKAIMSIDAEGLAKGLKIPEETKAVFSQYVTNKPALPLDDQVKEKTEWVKQGALASDNKTHYNTLETKHVGQHYENIINAVKKFIGASN